MPEREQQPFPEWAERDRGGDLGWIRQNLETFWPVAQQGYQAVGRGAVVVDTTTTVTHPGGEGHPYGYYDHDTLKQFSDRDTLRLVRDYRPDSEFVTTLLKAQDRVSSYRLRVVSGPLREEAGAWGAEEAPSQRPAAEVQAGEGEPPAEADSETLTPPDLETLAEWESEGWCEAACPHQCVVETDGTCEHGNPSWLLKLGLI
jgi:hypothetical protein